MNRYSKLAWPAYTVALMLFMIPFFDATMSVWPLNPGSEQWRFGAVGLMSNAFMIPAVGILIAVATALTLGHYRFLRVVGVLCALGSVVAGITILLFTMDAVQTRFNIVPEVRTSFMVATATAAVKLLLASLALAAFAVAGLKSKPETTRKAASDAPAASRSGQRAVGPLVTP